MSIIVVLAVLAVGVYMVHAYDQHQARVMRRALCAQDRVQYREALSAWEGRMEQSHREAGKAEARGIALRIEAQLRREGVLPPLMQEVACVNNETYGFLFTQLREQGYTHIVWRPQLGVVQYH